MGHGVRLGDLGDWGEGGGKGGVWVQRVKKNVFSTSVSQSVCLSLPSTPLSLPLTISSQSWGGGWEGAGDPEVISLWSKPVSP